MYNDRARLRLPARTPAACRRALVAVRFSSRATRLHAARSMNKLELKAYLNQIYGIKVESVNTKNMLGRMGNTVKPGGGARGKSVRRPAYKLAYVTLADGEEFTFPELFLEDDDDDETEQTSP